MCRNFALSQKGILNGLYNSKFRVGWHCDISKLAAYSKIMDTLNYDRIAKAIDYIRDNFKSQPGLEEVAEQVHLSPFHFQRLFTEWAGTSPKNFLQYTSIEYAKKLLRDNSATLFDAAYETGLSGTGRLHDLFIKIEGMTPAEYRDGGRNLSVGYGFYGSPFGEVILASTSKGICHMAFVEDKAMAIAELQLRFPNAALLERKDTLHEAALSIFRGERLCEVKLHLKGTPFQLKVWETLLKIPAGGVATYSAVAAKVGTPKASRAVGTAIGSNPVAYLIPCHRVIKSTGEAGGYMWGPTRKTALIGWEAARQEALVK